MKALRSARTLAASLGVLVVGALAASPAMAFDNLEWNWKKDVKEEIDIDAYIDLDVDITGMVEIEKLQIFLGDVKATSYVSHIYNDPIRKTEYVKLPDGYGDGGHDYPKPPKPQYPSFFSGKGGHDNYDPCKKDSRSRCDNDKPDVKYKEVKVPLDARYELPIVVSAATAVGNNQSITSDVPVFLHDGQFVANVRDRRFECNDAIRCGSTGFDVAAFEASLPTTSRYPGGGNHYDKPEGNLHTTVAGLFTLGAVLGVLTKADIEAKSEVHAIRNASVDSSATAVANNISVELASDVDGSCTSGCTGKSNHIVIGDITQFALANVTATSKVYDVRAEGYNHMRELTTTTLSPREGDPGYTIAVPTPWVSSVATAVGNNVSITVGRDLKPVPKTN